MQSSLNSGQKLLTRQGSCHENSFPFVPPFTLELLNQVVSRSLRSVSSFPTLKLIATTRADNRPIHTLELPNLPWLTAAAQCSSLRNHKLCATARYWTFHRCLDDLGDAFLQSFFNIKLELLNPQVNISYAAPASELQDPLRFIAASRNFLMSAVMPVEDKISSGVNLRFPCCSSFRTLLR